jgi:hypothetical protein
MAPRRRSHEPRFPMLVGWLFADLFLMLFVVGIASLPPAPRTVPHPLRSPSPAPQPPKPRVLERHPVSFAIPVSPSAVQDPATHSHAIALILRDIRWKLAARRLLGRHAWFVLIFASGPVTAISQAQSTARLVLRTVRNRDAMFSGASGEGFWMGSNDDFNFQVFFFA